MIRLGTPTIAECDSCGVEAEAVEARNPRTDTVSWGFLPAGWKFDLIDGDHVHRCGACFAAAVAPFADRRAAFEARLDHLGRGLLVDIAHSLGVPLGIARRWTAEWVVAQDNPVSAARFQILGTDGQLTTCGYVTSVETAADGVLDHIERRAARVGRDGDFDIDGNFDGSFASHGDGLRRAARHRKGAI